MKRSLYLLLVFLLASLACRTAVSTAQPADLAATHAAQTVEAAASATAPALPETPVDTALAASPVPSLDGVSLSLPDGWNATAQSELVPEANNADLPHWEIHPAYTHISLQGYALQEKFFEPEFFIYPADDYGRLNPAAAQTISDLKALLASPDPLPEHMPFLPTLNAAQVFYSNPAILSFQNGRGFRYLTQYDQAPLPVNNHELFYTYQGFTQDGRYYVSAILPVNAPFLAMDGSPDSSAPPDAVPFPWDDYASMPVYLQAIRDRLEGTDSGTFTPSLNDLDSLVQSLSIDLP